MQHTRPQVGALKPRPAVNNTDIFCKSNRLDISHIQPDSVNGDGVFVPSQFGVEIGGIANFDAVLDRLSTIWPESSRSETPRRHRSASPRESQSAGLR